MSIFLRQISSGAISLKLRSQCNNRNNFVAQIISRMSTGSEERIDNEVSVNGSGHPAVLKLEKKRGVLLVLEGCDKAGKTTQCKRLLDALTKAGRPCHLISFPDRTTEIGKMIDQYLKCTKQLTDEAIHLLFSANRWELAPKIRNLLLNGESVIVDRYAFSGVAFSAAKGTLDLEWCMAADVGLPQPDKVFYLNVSKDVAAKRGGFGNERYEKEEFQEKVKKVFLRIQDHGYWRIVDADQTEDQIHKEVLRYSFETIALSAERPIIPLWYNRRMIRHSLQNA